MMTDDEGNVLWQNDFSPFGEETGKSGFVERDGFYTGKKIDRDTGLYYFNARWYDPELGRFITEDPVKDGVNWFSYVKNNPLTFVDPTGLYGMTADDYNSLDDDTKADYKGYREERQNRANKEKVVKNHFKYMKDEKLDSDEIDNYYELTMIQKNIDAIEEAIKELDPETQEEVKEALYFMEGANEQLRNLRNQYDEKLLDSIHLQTDPRMTPDGAGACFYRSIQAGIEFGLKSPMPMSMINKSTAALTGSGLSMNSPGGNSPGAEYIVAYKELIANDALSKLSSNLKAGYTLDPKKIPSNSEFSFSIRYGKSITQNHFNLGKQHNTDFYWDPSYGRTNHISNSEVTDLRYFYFK